MDDQIKLSDQSGHVKNLKNDIKINSDKKEVIDNFETQFLITSTFLSKEILDGIQQSPWHSNIDEGRRLLEKSKDRVSLSLIHI